MATLEDLRNLVKRLRAPDGCPWDRAQDLPDLKQYLLEECYEVLDAIDHGAGGRLGEELGDLLFQIVFVAVLAEERGSFGLQQVLDGIYDKMVRRHPHVFGTASAEDPAAVRANWWKIKQEEGSTPLGQLEGIPRALPALQRAYRLGQRAAQAGFDWVGPEPVLEKVKEELRELEQALSEGEASEVREELGDLLFALANFARLAGINPEEALQQGNDKFLDRFRRMEELTRERGRRMDELGSGEMDHLWEEVKDGK